MTMIADTLYSMLAKQLRGFEYCDAKTIYRHFIHGKGIVSVEGNKIHIVFPLRAHNPILRNVQWDKLPQNHPALEQANIDLSFM